MAISRKDEGALGVPKLTICVVQDMAYHCNPSDRPDHPCHAGLSKCLGINPPDFGLEYGHCAFFG